MLDANKPGEWLASQEGRGLRRDALRDSPGHRQCCTCTVGSHGSRTELRTLHAYLRTVAIPRLSKVRAVPLAFTKELGSTCSHQPKEIGRGLSHLRKEGKGALRICSAAGCYRRSTPRGLQAVRGTARLPQQDVS